MHDEWREAEILNDYIDLLNTEGLESPAELAFFRRHEEDAQVARLLRGARALKATLADAGGGRLRAAAAMRVE
jgi:hypothetical protein